MTVEELAQAIEEDINAVGYAAVRTPELMNLFSSSPFYQNGFFLALDNFARQHGWKYGPKAKEDEEIAGQLVFQPENGKKKVSVKK